MIGFFGGAFDPVHYGHLKNASHLKKTLALSSLFLMPCGKSAHKRSLHFSAVQRLKMLRLSLQTFSDLTLDLREIARIQPSYTIHSLKAIRRQYPTQSVCFIIGMDSFMHIQSWKNWQDLKAYAHLVVISRPNYANTKTPLQGFKTVQNVQSLHQKKAGLLYFAEAERLDISSSQIRGKIRNQRNLSGFAPEPVIHYLHSLCNLNNK